MVGYDYTCAGHYFVTIVTQNRCNLFGEIVNGEMILNDAGLAIESAIETIPQIQPMSDVPVHVVMPNHIHFVISLFGELLLAKVIQGFKSYTTSLYYRGMESDRWFPLEGKLWQRNYFEHIIRNQRSYDYIANYIVTNPRRWLQDKVNVEHIEQVDEIIKDLLSL